MRAQIQSGLPVVMLSVEIDGKTVLEYEPHARLPGKVRELLERMDADLAAGPDSGRRTEYVAMTLVRAIVAGRARLQAAACAWLGSRAPALRTIRASTAGDDITMQLVMD